MTLSPVELLSDKHLLDDFGCGKPALDEWLRSFARTNHQRGFTRVLVVHEEFRVAGYYGIAPSAIEAKGVPRRIRTGRPPDPIPCLLIGQLAVDSRYSRRGVGTALVKDALLRCIAGAEVVGGRAVVVRAVDQQAEAFWRSWGFIPSRDNPSVLMCSLDDLRLWLAETG